LIGSSLGRPREKTCGRETACSRCGDSIVRGEICYDVPQPTKPHSSTRRFCRVCFEEVLRQTKCDLSKLEAMC
jgi:hypothetical protein